MIDTLPVTDAVLLRETPFASKKGWGVRYAIAADLPVVAVSLYREAERLKQPLGIGEEMLQYFAKEFLADHHQEWTALPTTSAATVGTLTSVAIPDSDPEQLAVVIEFALAVPASVHEAPQLIFTDILRGLVFPDDLPNV